MNRTIYRIFQGFAWVAFVGFLLQFFLAGLGVFRAATFAPHRTLGDLLMVASVALLILALASIRDGNRDRWRVGLAALLVVLMLLQYLLASDFLQEGAPAISALHPVNGLLLVFVSYALAHGRGLPWGAAQQSRMGGTDTESSRVR